MKEFLNYRERYESVKNELQNKLDLICDEFLKSDEFYSSYYSTKNKFKINFNNESIKHLIYYFDKFEYKKVVQLEIGNLVFIKFVLRNTFSYISYIFDTYTDINNYLNKSSEYWIKQILIKNINEKEKNIPYFLHINKKYLIDQEYIYHATCFVNNLIINVRIELRNKKFIFYRE